MAVAAGVPSALGFSGLFCLGCHPERLDSQRLIGDDDSFLARLTLRAFLACDIGDSLGIRPSARKDCDCNDAEYGVSLLCSLDRRRQFQRAGAFRHTADWGTFRRLKCLYFRSL